jgi:hypothetical protein
VIAAAAHSRATIRHAEPTACASPPDRMPRQLGIVFNDGKIGQLIPEIVMSRIHASFILIQPPQQPP